MVAPDIRSLFPNGGGPGLPPLASSPPRWPEQFSRQLASVPTSGGTTGSGSTFSQGLSSNSGHHFGQASEFHRVTSLPVDTWASPVAPSKIGQHHSPSGYPSSLGQFRTPPPGMSSASSGLGHGTPGTGFFSPNNHGQQPFSPEGPYTYGSGFQTPGSTSSSHLYSNNNSPVQGTSTNIGGFGPLSPAQQQPQRHQPSPQRPISGSSTSSRDSLQGLEDRIPPSNFGSGYGVSLNSGNVRTLQQQMAYQHQQQGYISHSNFGQSAHYPLSRQRHSSHSSNASHHTMFLGPIGGDSVHSDEISTEDESDEPFDEMRNRLRSHHTLSQPSYRQSLHGVPNFSAPPTSSVLYGRRGSVPSMGSMYSNQQLYSPQQPQQHFQNGLHHHHHHQSVTPPPSVIRPSHSNSDLYGRKSLVSAMARHSLGPPENNSNSNGSNRGISLGSALPGLNERDLFSSGLGGIIGGGTIHTNGTSNGSSHESHVYHVVDNHAKGNKSGGSDESHVSSGVLMNSTLSPSALPFLDPPGQHMVGGWDR